MTSCLPTSSSPTSNSTDTVPSTEWLEFFHPRNLHSLTSSPPPIVPLYFNLRTGIAQWTLPGGCNIIRHNAPQWWQLHSAELDRDFFYNPRTGQTLWSAPEGQEPILDVAAAMRLAHDIDRPEATIQEEIESIKEIRLPQRRNARVFAR